MNGETTYVERLTLDQAVAHFHILLREELGARIESGSYAPEAPEITEARYFRWAEALIRTACPDPPRCANRRCRRGGCRHLADLAAKQKAAPPQEFDGCTPAHHALRRAMWVYMNAKLALASSVR